MSQLLIKAIRILKYLFVLLVILLLLLVGAVNLPVVHTFLTSETNSILQKKGIPVHIGKITLLLNGKIGVSECELILPQNDTVVYAGKVSVDIRPLPLLSKKVVINSINLSDAVVNILTDSITGDLLIASVFNSSGETIKKSETEVDSTTNKKPWDVSVRNIQFKNIRVTYSDPNGGILVRQNIAKADIGFDTFSLLNQQIDFENIEISKPEGMVGIWEAAEKPDEESQTSTWQFSLQNLEINDLQFILDQPDSRQQLKVALKNGNLSLEKLDLATSEILIRKVELIEPEVTLLNNDIAETETVQETTSPSFSIPTIPWTIVAESFKITDGNLSYTVTNKELAAKLEKWLPLHDLNALFENTRITPEGYNLNLEKLSFELANAVKIKSGSLQFTADQLQNLGLKTDLAILIAAEKKGWFTRETQLDFAADFSGTTEVVQIEKLDLQSSSGLSFAMNGSVLQPLNMPQSGCNLRFSSGTISRSQLATIVKVFSPEINLPAFKPFTLSGNIKNSLEKPVFNLKVNSGSGKIEANGRYDVKKINGELQASFTDILLSELMGEVYPEKLTGKLQLKGGLNRSNMPEGEVSIEIDSVRYKNKTSRNIALNGSSQNNEVKFTVNAMDSALNCNFEGNIGWNSSKEYFGALKGNFDIDLFGLNLISEPFSGKASIDASFVYAPDKITASLNIPGFTIRNSNDTVTLGKTEFNLTSTDSIIESRFISDFLTANFKSLASFADFKNAFDSTKVETIINLDSANFINHDTYSNLKYFNLDATLRDNQVFNLFFPDTVLNFSDIKISATKADINTQLEATVSTPWIDYNKIKIFNTGLLARFENDRLKFQVQTDSIRAGEIKFGKSGIGLDVLPASILGKLEVKDQNDSILHEIGFEAKKVNDLITLKSATSDWIIDKNHWNLSPPEFLTWEESAKILTTSLDMNWNDKYITVKGKNTEMIELDIKNLQLNNLAIPGLIGFVPEGIIDANVKYSQGDNHNIELNMEMQQMKWGNIHFNKLSANGHLVSDSTGITDSEITLNADDSLSFKVEMTTNDSKREMQVKSRFNKLHFQLFEPFISEYASHLHGTSSGEVNLTIVDEKPAINGEIRFDDFGLKIIPLEAWLTIPDNKIEIKQNQLTFNNFTVIDSLKRPLTVNGKIGFENSENIWADLNVKADKILLMNTSENDNAEFFGSILVNSGLKITGSLFSPEIKGNIELENGTNLTYQLIQDLSVEASQTDVVFASITDGLQVIYPANEKVKRVTRMPKIETVISINPKSIFNVKIDELYGVDITIAGDGLLNYNMLPNNTMSLNGLYEIKTGDCKLKITGWPVKEFKITPGSSFRWNGNVENPELNLEATTKVKGSYLNPIDNKSRAVDFVVSMQLKNQLSDLAIIFAIQSPDQYITSVLSSLSSDEIMRQAVNLLLFETIDLPGIESSGNYVASQINSFWESQLNALTKTTFNKTSLSFGIDTYDQTTTSGTKETTSFTYEMERKFMNDRATVKLSGRLNEYEEGAHQTNSIFENFIFEYALDDHDSKYLKLYQKKDYQDMLEGEVIKYGAGFLYRKNYNKLREIWQRKKKNKTGQTTKE